jgi:hypothetical protein
MTTEHPLMDSVLFEIAPSPKDRNSHLGLGIISAVFALLLAIFIIWSGVNGQIGTWTTVILSLPVLLFGAVSWFVLRFGVDYVLGVRVYPFGIGTFYPLKKDPERQEQIVRFEEIQRLEVEENLEVHRTGRRIKSINVYRIRVVKNGEVKPELLADMINLLPEQILKFRQLPDVLIKNQLLPAEKIDKSQMPL